MAEKENVLKEEINTMREKLNNLLISNDDDTEVILRASQELDRIILKYVKHKVAV